MRHSFIFEFCSLFRVLYSPSLWHTLLWCSAFCCMVQPIHLFVKCTLWFLKDYWVSVTLFTLYIWHYNIGIILWLKAKITLLMNYKPEINPGLEAWFRKIVTNLIHDLYLSKFVISISLFPLYNGPFFLEVYWCMWCMQDLYKCVVQVLLKCTRSLSQKKGIWKFSCKYFTWEKCNIRKKYKL